MAVTAQGSGTQTATINTEHTLLDIAIPGTFTCHVDLFNMASGDVVELRIYQMILTGGTHRVVYHTRIPFSQVNSDSMIFISVPVSNELTDAAALRFTLKQTNGTGRNFDWKVLKYA